MTSMSDNESTYDNNAPTNAQTGLSRRSSDQILSRIEKVHAQFHNINLENWDFETVKELHRLVHSLAGLAGAFGFNALRSAAQKLEMQLSQILTENTVPDQAHWLEITQLQNQLGRLALYKLQSNAPNLLPPIFQPLAKGSPLVHIVDDDDYQAYQIGVVLEDNGYRVRYFTDLNGFLAAWSNNEHADAIIMDVVFPQGELAGTEALKVVSENLKAPPPIIVISIRNDFEARLASIRAGASYYLSKPINPLHLLTLLDPLTVRLPVEPYRALMLDDDPLLLEINAEVLRQAGIEVFIATDPLQAYEMLCECSPDVVILDMYMPDISGAEFAAVLRAIEAFSNIPILFLSGEQNFDKQVMALKFGGDIVLTKPVQPMHLVSLVTSRAQRMRQYNSTMDFLQRTLYEREQEHLAIDHHAIVSISDQTGIIIYVNDKFCAVSGYHRDELLGENHNILKSDQHTFDFYQNMWRALTSGNVWQGILCNRNKAGTLYWLDTTIVPFLDNKGNPYQYVAIQTDISKLKSSTN